MGGESIARKAPLTETALTWSSRTIGLRNALLLMWLIASDKNTSTKVSEKLSKSKDLEIEFTRTWEVKTEIIPVVVGALGVIKKGLEKFVRQIQKTTLLGTAHILRKVPSIN